MRLITRLLPFALLAYSSLTSAKTYPLPPPGSDVVGDVQYTESLSGETLADVARRFNVGVYEMVESNDGIRMERVLSVGTDLVVPSMYILPPGPRTGLVINLAELRMYYYPPGTHTVITEPVGIGREGWQTPLGSTYVISKTVNPSWHPTKNVIEDARLRGIELPKTMPPGPENPLGDYAMRLGWREYLIHGTNRPEGVGRRSSAGCIRMYPEGIENLFARVKIGTKVTIIDEPFKVGWYGKQLFFEAHTPLQETAHNYENDMTKLVRDIHRKTNNKRTLVKWRDTKAESKKMSGIPVRIGFRK